MDRGFFRKHLSCLLGPNGSVFTDGQTGFNSAFSFAQAGNNVLQFAPGSRLSKRANVCCLAVKLNVGGSRLLVEVKINGSVSSLGHCFCLHCRAKSVERFSDC